MSDAYNRCDSLTKFNYYDNNRQWYITSEFTHDTVIVGFGVTSIYQWWLVK